jgi:hypothetical protein
MCTNQLWGLAWGGLVFGELAGQQGMSRYLVVGGSVVMIFGAIAISSAVAPEAEQSARKVATSLECQRYDLSVNRVEAALTGTDPLSLEAPGRRWWDGVIVIGAAVVFFALARATGRLPFAINGGWTAALVVVMLASLCGCGYLLWKRTQFS